MHISHSAAFALLMLSIVFGVFWRIVLPVLIFLFSIAAFVGVIAILKATGP